MWCHLALPAGINRTPHSHHDASSSWYLLPSMLSILSILIYAIYDKFIPHSSLADTLDQFERACTIVRLVARNETNWPEKRGNTDTRPARKNNANFKYHIGKSDTSCLFNVLHSSNGYTRPSDATKIKYRILLSAADARRVKRAYT